MMRKEWFIVRYVDGEYSGRSPYALSKSEADGLLAIAEQGDKVTFIALCY